MRRLFKTAIRILIVAMLVAIGWLNVGLYRAPRGASERGEIAADAFIQLNSIGRRLRAGEGRDMQAIFPEGWFFSHALYGFAWINVGLQTKDAALRQRAVDEARWVLERMESPEGLAPFIHPTQVPNGVFYRGWRNRLLGGLLLLQSATERRREDVAAFQEQSEMLASAFRATPSLHLDAYPGQAWPCDNVMGLASLRIHDAIFGARYQAIIDAWVTFTMQHLDSDTGLIVHQIDGRTGRATIGARASTQVYIHALLPELSAPFAREQYAIFRRTFVDDWLGFLPVREYPHGKTGHGDIDTGPLVFGISPSATVVSIAAARANGDFELAERNVILSEIVGVPWTSGDEKSFGFGKIVVADAFLAWGKTLVPWTPVEPVTGITTSSSWWRWRIHAISLALAVLGGWLTRAMTRQSITHSRQSR